jgi:2-succinyl-6-hydroxy-2,4-cyclohexadiene-1-carboxylate synthase
LESSSPGLASPSERATRRARDNALANRIEQEGVAPFVDHWENISLFASHTRLETAVRANLRQQRLQNNAHGLANSLRGMGTGQQPSLWGDLSQLTVPTLLIAGELDSKYAAINQQMAAQFPYARLTIVADAGHTVHLEKPATFAALVLDFLGSLS